MTLFGPLFVPQGLLDSVSDRAWVQAMLDAEAALARAQASLGIVPAEAAAAISESCRAELVQPDELAREGRAVGNPAEPLARALRAAVGGEAAGYVHFGATSQDIIDTAAMLVSRRALDEILPELDRLAEGLAALARAHRSTPMVARTLLQQALPTTFGLKAAGWLVGVLDARTRLRDVRNERLAAQFGGAAGTLAVFGDQGTEVLAAFARELDLEEPELAWHTNRTRIAELGGALDLCAGVVAKVALDVALLAQTEVGEVREGASGGSSTLPQKRNPVGSTLARANARLVSGYATVLSGALTSEHERAAGAWHAEWQALSGALAHAGGATTALADVVGELEVDAPRMRENLEATGGLVAAERVAYLLAGRIGRDEAHAVVRDAAFRASDRGTTFEEALAQTETGLSVDELQAALDPTTSLGSAEAFVDRALERYERESAENA